MHIIFALLAGLTVTFSAMTKNTPAEAMSYGTTSITLAIIAVAFAVASSRNS